MRSASFRSPDSTAAAIAYDCSAAFRTRPCRDARAYQGVNLGRRTASTLVCQRKRRE
jgi:hypothetical protein